MLYDPQQRPTVSMALQYPFFQANNALPAPANTAEAIASTFTRRPVQKSETEMKLEERAQAKQVGIVCDEWHLNPQVVCGGYNFNPLCLYGCNIDARRIRAWTDLPGAGGQHPA